MFTLLELGSKDIPFSVWRLTEEEGQQCWELVFFFHSSAWCCFLHFELPLPRSLFLIFPPLSFHGGCHSSTADLFQKRVQCAFLGTVSSAATLCTLCYGWWLAHMVSSFLQVKNHSTAQSIGGRREQQSGTMMWHSWTLPVLA